MNKNELEFCLECARTAALEAWEIISGYFRGQFRIIEKDGDGPATEADIEADHHIVDFLQREFPPSQFGYLSEETQQGLERLDKKYCWIIDPIDGTREFIEGRDDFAIHVGMVGVIDGSCDDSVPVLGVVYTPRSGLLYTAAHGMGAHLENMADGSTTPLHVTTQAEVARATLVVTRQSQGRRLKAAIARLQAHEVLLRGSFGVKVMDVVAGRSDLYLNTSRRYCKEWDAAAPHAILQEAGGMLTDLSGHPIRYNKADVYLHHGVVASNGVLHREVISHLASVAELWEN